MLDNTGSCSSVRYMDRSEGKIEEGEKRKEGKVGGREGCCLPTAAVPSSQGVAATLRNEAISLMEASEG